jgi:hypothetical protein
MSNHSRESSISEMQLVGTSADPTGASLEATPTPPTSAFARIDPEEADVDDAPVPAAFQAPENEIPSSLSNAGVASRHASPCAFTAELTEADVLNMEQEQTGGIPGEGGNGGFPVGANTNRGGVQGAASNGAVIGGAITPSRLALRSSIIWDHGHEEKVGTRWVWHCKYCKFTPQAFAEGRNLTSCRFQKVQGQHQRPVQRSRFGVSPPQGEASDPEQAQGSAGGCNATCQASPSGCC